MPIKNKIKVKGEVLISLQKSIIFSVKLFVNLNSALLASKEIAEVVFKLPEKASSNIFLSKRLFQNSLSFSNLELNLYFSS